jgi:UDP-glucose 4-epimerase
VQRVFVTGAAGFIGSTLVDRLLARDADVDVVGWDNLSTGRLEFLEDACAHPRFRLVRGDTLNAAALTRAMAGAGFVFHLAANADVRDGTSHPRRDLEQNTIATFNVLEAMRANGIGAVAFASTGSIYGEPEIFPTPETAPFPIQTSLYGASKLAAEGLLDAYAAGFGFRVHIFRFVSILGERYTHGHVLDFYRKLTADPRRIEVLGNGRQRKSYLYVQDCVDAMLTAIECTHQPVNVFNLGADESITVDESLDHLCAALGVNPERHYTGGERGWVGDSPFILLDTSRIRSLGWAPTLTIRDALSRTLAYLQANPRVLALRS